MNSNTLILRRYSFKDRVVDKINRELASPSMIPIENAYEKIRDRFRSKPQEIDKSMGQPVHRVINNAMLDAENELGLPPEGNHKELAYKELQNPASNFSKTFNAYKKQIGEVPNPQQHMKHVFVPLLKHFAKHGESGLTPLSLDESHEAGEGTNALAPKRQPNPFDFTVKEGPGFSYRPDTGTPHGFVQVPDKGPFDVEYPTKRVIKNPALHPQKRNEVYQTIAHALANKEDVHQALAEQHGFDQLTAQRHYNNFLRNKKRPEGKIRPENQTPQVRSGGTGQGGIRRKKFDRTDLMAIPVKYALIGDHMPPSMRKQVNDERSRRRIPEGWGSVGVDTPGGSGEPEEEPEEHPLETAQNWHGGLSSGLYRIGSGATDRDSIEDAMSEVGHLLHTHPSHSNLQRLHEHLTELESQLPPEPEEEEPVQLSAYRAPKGGAIIRGSQYKGGEMVPSMTGSFMNPRRKSLKNK